ncbi:hypothetical protein [Parafilimonas terrae]|uniref:GIY-YIG domain-containing protein n=1 Tax=Parafilimonas terrae TaxID=1465490 RepID=A0A1I5VIW1_9BACT|nr:hypothetical protein [Parafilimonas terrae]SFQ07455.1 hypothetical protein SAMN05444277_10517 [Parafilimonas terrae]
MITQATLDLLDADIRKDVRRYNRMPFKDRHKIFSHEIRIDPYWCNKKFQQIPVLNWSADFKFSSHPDFQQIITTNDIGVYIMYVKPVNLLIDMPQYVMYVGISGENGSARPLRDRLMDYFYISKIKLRNNIHTMLQLYYDHVYIKYALFNGTYQSLEQLEEILHEFFYPKFGKRDFEPETKAAHSAWNTGQ